MLSEISETIRELNAPPAQPIAAPGSRTHIWRYNNVYAELKRIHSPDVADLRTYSPTTPYNFGFLLQLEVGPNNLQAADTFDVMVCTPEWFKDRHKATDVLLLRNYLLVFQYDYPRLIHFIEKYCMRCSGETWEEIVAQLSHLGKWEFEGLPRRGGNLATDGAQDESGRAD